MKTFKALLLILLLTVIACEKQPKPDDTASPGVMVDAEALDLQEAILHMPEGIISSRQELQFEFRKAIVEQHFVGSVLDRNPLSFEPNIKGDAIWRMRHILVFVPSEPLPPGTTIQGVLHGKAALGEQKNVNDLPFSFKVAEQEVVGFTGEFVPVKGERNTARFKGRLEFAQQIDIAQLNKDLVIKGPDGKLGFELAPDVTNAVIDITSDPVKRTLKGKDFKFTLPKSYTASKESWENHIPLPGEKEFKVIADMDMSDPEADGYIYGFRFNEQIKSGMDLSGFVSITPEINYTIKTDGRYLLVSGPFVPGQQYRISIREGLPSAYETRMDQAYNKNFSLENIKPEIDWLSQGVYLPTSNQYKLQFKSVNIAKVKITVYEILPQNVGFFIQENMLRDNSEQWRTESYYYGNEFIDLYRTGVVIYDQFLDITSDKNKWIRNELDLTPVFKNKSNSVFVVKAHFDKTCLTGKPVTSQSQMEDGALLFTDNDYYNSPARDGYYYSRGDTYKMLISSDIGLTVKKAGDGTHVFATNVLTAKPSSGLDLGLYSYQNQKLQSVSTDANGYAFFDSTNYNGYIYGENSSGMALIKLNHPGWEMNSFDVGGQSGARNGVDAFIYTDRGVHRPGDTVHFSAIIRFNRQLPPAEQPVMLTVTNPLGQKAFESKTDCGKDGHVYFAIPTGLDDPTGNWNAKLTIAKQAFNRNLKIETVKPNRLKVYNEAPDMIGDDHILSGTVSSTYLFGAPAANLKTVVDAVLLHKELESTTFHDYIFSSPLKYFDQQFRTIYDGKLNEDGKANYYYQFTDLNNANGLVRVALHTRVFEKGGSFTESYKNTTLDPYGAYAGVRNVFESNYVRMGEKAELPIVSVNADGEPLPGRKLKVECYVNRHYWWWHYDDRDRQKYINSRDTFRISSNTYTSKSEPVMHPISIDDYGSHYIKVTDVESGHEAGFFFRGTRWGRGVAEEAGEDRNILQIRSDKNIYNIGDRAELSFDTPASGTAVLTLEQGDKILHREWKVINSTRTSFNVSLDMKTVPNVYAVVTVVQPHDQKNNDLPIRLYGVKTLYVEDENTRLPLFIDAPEKLEPKKDFTVQVRSLAQKPATFTLAVVDEGLLDLTAFKTPKPWDYFFQKIRLAVRSLDNYNEIIGLLFPDMDKYFSIGGGMMEEDRLDRLDRSQVQRFKPVVLYQKPMTVNPGKDVSVTFTMPNYVGSVRIMLVGASRNSYVSVEETVPVKQPLMVLPDIPRVARPGDVFELPVTVFAMEDAVRDVNVSLRTSTNLQPDTTNLGLTFTKIGDQTATFRVKVGNRIGGDTLKVKATSGQFTADNLVTLPVNSANPYYTEVRDTMLTNDFSLEWVAESFGLQGTNAASLVFSKIPNLNIDERLNYLVRYPYGCLEQTTSSVFPQLFLNDLADIKGYQKERVTANINAAIKRYESFRLNDGFSYWPVSTYYRHTYNDWASSYAGHFMVLARDKGYHVPNSLYDHWLSGARRHAKDVNLHNHRYQCYRLFTLALAGKPEMGAMNLVRENHLKVLDPLARKLLAASYYLAGQKDAASQVDQSDWSIDNYREMSGTYGSALRDQAMIAYLCTLMDDIKSASMIMKQVTERFNSRGWYSTQETAMVLLAASTIYSKTSVTDSDVELRVQVQGDKSRKIKLNAAQQVLELPNAFGKTISITSESKQPVYVALQVEGIPIEDRVKTENQGLGLIRNFYNDEGYPISVDEIKQGQSFWVKYTVNNLHGGNLEELALTSKFPSGWEVLNQRMTGAELPDWVRKEKPSSGEFMDIRDDRINWFFDLRSNQKMVFMAHLNATFKGEFRIPPVSVEAMYSPEYYARHAGYTTIVK